MNSSHNDIINRLNRIEDWIEKHDAREKEE